MILLLATINTTLLARPQFMKACKYEEFCDALYVSALTNNDKCTITIIYNYMCVCVIISQSFT